MKHVWAYDTTPNDDLAYPDLYSSEKKAMSQFNSDYEAARARGLEVTVTYDNGAAASWEDNGRQYSIRVEKLPVS